MYAIKPSAKDYHCSTLSDELEIVYHGITYKSVLDNGHLRNNVGIMPYEYWHYHNLNRLFVTFRSGGNEYPFRPARKVV